MDNPYQDHIVPNPSLEYGAIDTSKQYPYDEDGHLIKRDAQHPYPLNIRFNAPGVERAFVFQVSHLDELVSFDMVRVINADVSQLSYLFEWSYTIDGTSWSPFKSHWEQFIAEVNASLDSSLNVWIRAKLKTFWKEDQLDYERGPAETNDPRYQVPANTDPVTDDPRNKAAMFELAIDRFKINDEDHWIETVDGEDVIHFYVPQFVEIPRSVGLVRDLTSNLFNIYANMDKAQEINLANARAAALWTGHWVYYFRTMPDQESKSATFRQYTIKNVVDVKMIKMSIPGNKIPSNRNTFTEWGINFAEEFQVHFLNEFFETAFGPEQRPHTDDYVFFPLTGRMYNVNTGTDRKAFMYKSTFTEVVLVKYEQRENVNDDMFRDNLLEFIEVQSMGGPEIALRQERQEAQPDYTDLRRYETVRIFMHQSVQITDNSLKINGTQVFKNMYLMSALYPETVAVRYRPLDRSYLKNLTIGFWFCPENVNTDRTILKYQSLTVSLLGGRIRLNQGTRAVSDAVTAGKLYHISISQSNDMSFMSLMVHEWDNANLALNFKSFNFEAAQSIAEVGNVELYGGKHLLGFLRLDDFVVDEASAITYIIDVQPDFKHNRLTDKCTPPVIQSRTIT